MERKLRTATAKLRNLKDFLSSTRNQQGQGTSSDSQSNPYQQDNHQNNRKSSKVSNGSGKPLSVSLFDLVEPCSRPTSFSPSSNGTLLQNSSNSVSLYGLSSAEVVQCQHESDKSSSILNSRPVSVISPSKNPALRLFYTIRSKFRKRRDRRSKNLESKSTDFGPFMTGNQAERYGGSSGGAGCSRSHYLEGAHSVDQLQSLGSAGTDADDTFSSPLGCRDRNYAKENTAPRISSATSCFVINADNSSYERPTLSPTFMNHTMDQPTTTCALANRNIEFIPRQPPPVPSSSLSLSVNQTSTSSPTKSSVSPSEPNKLKGLAKELFDLIHYGWYWGGLSKEEAEEKLRNEPDGAFIVRDSSSSVHILSLSFNSNGKTKHTRIDYVEGKFCFLTSETEAFSSVAELIEHWIKNSEQGIYCYSKSNRTNGPKSYPVRLTKPISRFTEVKSLQFLSSFVLYQYTRLDLIPKLPLPPQLIEFIGQQHYF